MKIRRIKDGKGWKLVIEDGAGNAIYEAKGKDLTAINKAINDFQNGKKS